MRTVSAARSWINKNKFKGEFSRTQSPRKGVWMVGARSSAGGSELHGDDDGTDVPEWKAKRWSWPGEAPGCRRELHGSSLSRPALREVASGRVLEDEFEDSFLPKAWSRPIVPSPCCSYQLKPCARRWLLTL